METSVPQATLLLACGDEVVSEQAFESERSQEVDLFTPLEALLSELPEGEKLSAVVIGTGPGSYNGARVGIATAQAIAQAHACGVAGLCSFEGVSQLRDDGWAVGDARRGSYFFLEVKDGRVIGIPELVGPEEMSDWLSKAKGPFVTFETGDRMKLFPDVESGTSEAALLFRSWRARSDEERAALFQKDLEAYYLRAPHITKAKPRKK